MATNARNDRKACSIGRGDARFGCRLALHAPGAYGDLSAILTCLSFATSQAPVSEEAAAGPPPQLAPALALSGAPLGSWGYIPDRLYARWGVGVPRLW